MPRIGMRKRRYFAFFIVVLLKLYLILFCLCDLVYLLLHFLIALNYIGRDDNVEDDDDNDWSSKKNQFALPKSDQHMSFFIW